MKFIKNISLDTLNGFKYIDKQKQKNIFYIKYLTFIVVLEDYLKV